MGQKGKLVNNVEYFCEKWLGKDFKRMKKKIMTNYGWFMSFKV